MSRNRVYISLAMVIITLAVVAAIYWNEARKEVVFLCGNFAKGVGKDSVMRQLDTGSFLRYQVEKNTAGGRIAVDSKLNFGHYKCVIEYDSEDKVIHAEIK